MSNKTYITALGMLILFCGNLRADSIDSLEKAATISESEEETVRIWNELAWKYQHTDADRSRRFAKKALKIAKENGWLLLQSDSENRLGNYYYHLGKYDSSVYYHGLCYQHRKTLNIPLLYANAAYSMGIVQHRLGLLDSSFSYFQEAIGIFQKLDKKNSLLTAKVQLAALLLDKKELIKGLSLINELQKEVNSNGGHEARTIADINLLLGRVNLLSKQYEQALKPVKKALELYSGSSNSADRARALSIYADVMYRLQRNDTASTLYQLAIEDSRRSGNRTLLFKLYANAAQNWSVRGFQDSASIYFSNAFDVLGSDSSNYISSTLFKQYADFLVTTTNYKKAIYYYDKALSLRREYSTWDQIEIAFNLHKAYEFLGETDAALDALHNYENLRDSQEKDLLALKDRQNSLELEKQEVLAHEKLRTTQLTYLFIITIILIVLFISAIAYQREKNKKLLALKDQKLAQQEIESLLKKQELTSIDNVLAIQEQERNKISRDIHDKLGGNLSRVQYMFTGIQETLEKIQKELAQSFDNAIQLLKETGDDLRDIAKNLNSGPYEKLGLTASLQELVSALEQSGKIQFEFHTHNVPKFPIVSESNIYRIVQEMISNTLKHANATEISLQLLYDEGQLNIVFEDNGKGFDKSKVVKGMGLDNIKSRVKELKGASKIESRIGVGTTYIVNIPIEADENS